MAASDIHEVHAFVHQIPPPKASAKVTAYHPRNKFRPRYAARLCAITTGVTQVEQVRIDVHPSPSRTVDPQKYAYSMISEARATAIHNLDEIFLSPDQSITMHDDRVARRFENIIKRLLKVCAEVEKMGLPEKALDEMKQETRRAFEKVWLEGDFGCEIVTWPRGMGSAKAMQIIYEGANYQTSSLKAHYSERFLRSADLAHAVRGRKDTLRHILEVEIAKRNGSHTRILDLGNGPCASLKELIPKLPRDTIESLCYVGVDQDQTAQEINIQHVKERHCQDHFSFLTKNVFRFDLRSEGPWDICYSTGLFDYLQDRTLVKMWSRIYESLNPNGIAVIGLKDCSQYHSELYRWLMRWDGFMQRDSHQFERLLEDAGLLDKVETVIREPTGIVLFYVVRKPL